MSRSQMTTDQIQQARELAATWIENEYSTGDDDTDRDFSLLARAVSSLTEQQPEPVSRNTVMAGQLWADNDKRNKGRTLRVDEIICRAGGDEPWYANCTIMTNADDTQEAIDTTIGGYRPQDRRGAKTSIRISRFAPTSTGYRLVSSPTEETTK